MLPLYTKTKQHLEGPRRRWQPAKEGFRPTCWETCSSGSMPSTKATKIQLQKEVLMKWMISWEPFIHKNQYKSKRKVSQLSTKARETWKQLKLSRALEITYN